jgi:hypothetical protein
MDATQCYICYEGATAAQPFAKQPCACKGSLQIHISCLQTLLQTQTHTTCKTCDTEYQINPLIKHTYYPDGVLQTSSAHFPNGMYITINYDSEGKPVYVRRPYNAYEYDVILFGNNEAIKSINYYTQNMDNTVTKIPIDPENYSTHWNDTIATDLLDLLEESI